MKIVRQSPASLPVRQPGSFSSPFFRRASVVFLLILAFGAGLVGQALGWFPVTGAAKLIQNPRFELASAWERARLPILYLDIKFQDAQWLEAQRQQSSATGVHVAAPGEGVSATVRLGNEVIPVEVRWPSGLVTLQEAGEWKIELTAQDRPLLGWQRVRVSHVTLAQWGLSESLRREGILAASIQPVRLVLNGDDWGVYGVWGTPGAELIARAGRPVGSVAYFDQTLYWQALLRQRGPGLAGVDLADCQTANIRTLDAPVELGNQAAVLLSELQTGQRAPAEKLDVERTGTLLALTMLWYGTPLQDWNRLAFYVGPGGSRLDPIVPGDLPQGSGALRWPVCFADPALQAAFVRAVDRVSQPAYLQLMQTELNDAFEQAQLTLDTTDGAPELTWGELAQRQKQMARWLEPLQMVWAVWSVPQTPLAPGAAIEMRLANLQAAPVEVLGFDIGKSTFLPVDPAQVVQDGTTASWTSANGTLVLRAAGAGGLQWVKLTLPYPSVFAAGRAIDEPVEIRVVTRWWGLERRHSGPAQQEGLR